MIFKGRRYDTGDKQSLPAGDRATGQCPWRPRPGLSGLAAGVRGVCGVQGRLMRSLAEHLQVVMSRVRPLEPLALPPAGCQRLRRGRGRDCTLEHPGISAPRGPVTPPGQATSQWPHRPRCSPAGVSRRFRAGAGIADPGQGRRPAALRRRLCAAAGEHRSGRRSCVWGGQWPRARTSPLPVAR